MVWPFSQIAEWAKVAAADRRPLPPAPRVLPRATPEEADMLARAALEVARRLVGCGEEGGNNQGPFVAQCIAPAAPPANWCAGFAGFCYEVAGYELGRSLPFRRSLGAKRLGANVAALGRRFTDPHEAQPGDLAVWHRGAAGSWMGHVAIVELACEHDEYPWVDVVEGNAGPRVRRSTRRPTSPTERFAFFASLRAKPPR